MCFVPPGWFVEVASEDRLLERADIEVKHIKPLLIEANLVHVNVSSGYSFVATLQPLILENVQLVKGVKKLDPHIVAPITPLAKVFSLRHKVSAEPLGEHWEPVDVRTRLLRVLESHAGGIVGVEVAEFPIVAVPLHLPQLVVQVTCLKVFSIDEVAKVESVCDVDELAFCSDACHQSHVRIKHLVHIRWAGGLVVDQASLRITITFKRFECLSSPHLDEIAVGNKRNIPEASSVVVHNLHVVKGARVVSIRG